MASIGPNNPTAATNDTTVGTEPWINPTFCFSSNNQYAYASFYDTIGTTYYLFTTGYGFSIPDGATIDGIVVEVERAGTAGGGNVVSLNILKLIKAGAVVGSDLGSGTWTATDTYGTYGGASNLWGTTWSVAEINASTFGAALSATISAAAEEFAEAYVDHIRITVYYTPSGGAASSANMFALF